MFGFRNNARAYFAKLRRGEEPEVGDWRSEDGRRQTEVGTYVVVGGQDEE